MTTEDSFCMTKFHTQIKKTIYSKSCYLLVDEPDEANGFLPLKEIVKKFKVIDNIFASQNIFLITLEQLENLEKLDLLSYTVTNGHI